MTRMRRLLRIPILVVFGVPFAAFAAVFFLAIFTAGAIVEVVACAIEDRKPIWPWWSIERQDAARRLA
jgi:ABC-type phosphate/phosphonate transport system permease subunit